MHQILKLFTSFILSLFLLAAPLSAADFPAPVGYVNDFAGLFSESFRQDMETDLSAFEQATGAEIAVVTVDNLGDTYLEDYAVRLFEEWGIGKKGQDNGLLLLIAEQERQIRIEIGYGLEPKITDAAAGRIIRDRISPAFKEGDYERGVRQGIEGIKSVVRDEDTPSLVSEEQVKDAVESFMPLVVFGIIALSYLSAFWARSKRFWPGGVVGGGAGALLGSMINSSPIWTGLGLGALGLFLDFILSRNYKKLQATGKPTGFWKSMGGFSGGGFKSGGGGGGFGGFGGGRSGGGGASGGW